MSEHEPRKLLIVYILEIMRKHSDRDHTLTEQEIVKLLKSEYGVTTIRKTVRRNLHKLMEADFPIRHEVTTEDTKDSKKDGKKQQIPTNWFYNHFIEYGELSLLINSVLFADGLYKRHRTDLIKKIEDLCSKNFKSGLKKIDMDVYGQRVNMDVLLTLDNIQLAIAEGRKMQFQYCNTGTDFKLHPRKDKNGKVRVYTVSPYQVIAKQGHQYLICNAEGHNDLTHFRIDRIKNSKCLKEPAVKIQKLHGFEHGLRISEYVREHPNLWSGDPRHITFRCNQNMLNDIVDSFGTDLHVEQQPDDMIQVYVHVGENDMLLWAVQFADAVEVLEPQDLRKRIAETLRKALEKYER